MTEAEALKNEGNALRAAGDLVGAAQRYRRAVSLDPAYGPALYNLAVLLQDERRFAEAAELFRRCIALDPRDRDALFRLGLSLAALGSHADALEAYRSALSVDPGNPLLWLEAGRVHRALGRRSEARDCLRRAVEHAPRHAETHNLLGRVCEEGGDLDEAVRHYAQASILQPGDAAYLNNLGCALALAGSLEAAAAKLREAVALDPGNGDGYRNLAEVCSALGRREEALAAYQAAYALQPEDAAVAAGLLSALQFVCDWSRLDELCAVRRRAVRDPGAAHIDPFGLLSIPVTRSEQLQGARAYAARLSGALAVEREGLGFRIARTPRKKLRIGYLSADFHAHATAHLTAELFELHDRARFEIHAYSHGPDDGSPMRKRLVDAFARFTDIARLSHAEAARAIFRDGIDILVDLKGYTAHARTQIVALRPAPIQVNYLGYPGSMGADFIDYIIGDRVVTPAEHAADYSEKIVRVSGCYQVNDRKRVVGAVPPRERLGLPAGAMVFFCFNQSYKILPEAFESWMRLLSGAPESVLWLLDWNASATANLRREAAARGVDPARLVFAPLLPQAGHLARIGAADLLLDTLPYNAHTVASDALWCGVPVLTLPGETFASRVAASQLTAARMPELIARSRAEYEAIALRLAANGAERAALRERLAQAKHACALFDAPAFTRDLEAAYERMWERHAAGRPPADIDL